MSKQNATASWSGYSHQGKVGLYLGLRKINELEVNEIEDFIIEYEQQEDIRLKREDDILSVHQVKAKTGGDTWGKYIDAIENFDGCEGDNYLHTIEEIRNWDDLPNGRNDENVERFEYEDEKFCCGLDEIDEYIDLEIKAILNFHQHDQEDNQGYRYRVRQYLLSLIDKTVRENHHSQQLLPKIELPQILEGVINNPDRVSSTIFAIRQAFYGSFIEFIQGLSDERWDEITDEHFEKVRDIVKKIYLLSDDDFIRFLRNINPDSTLDLEISEIIATDPFLSQRSLRNVFLNVLTRVTESELELELGVLPIYREDTEFVLTSIEEIEDNEKLVAKKIIQNKNVDFTSYKQAYLINQHLEGALEDKAFKFTEFEPPDSRKFKNKKGYKFIPREEAICKLNINN